MATGDEDSIEERLAKADQEIQRARLEEQIRERGGILGFPAGQENAAVSPEIEFAFLNHVLAWESGPFSSHAEWRARHGQVFAPPDGLRGQALRRELWRLIEALATARVFLYHTNHLSNAELYARLWHEVLDAGAPDFARTADDACHWDFADAGSDGEADWLTYYATAGERREWMREFPDQRRPARRRPAYRRDHRLPKRS